MLRLKPVQTKALTYAPRLGRNEPDGESNYAGVEGFALGNPRISDAAFKLAVEVLCASMREELEPFGFGSRL